MLLIRLFGRFGYADFPSSAAASKAIEKLSGMDLNGREVRLDNANSTPGGGSRGGRGGTPRGGGRGGMYRVCISDVCSDNNTVICFIFISKKIHFLKF